MAFCVCDYCGKAFNTYGSSVCSECSKCLDEAYLKARKYIYQNPRNANYTNIIENTEITEKALGYLISHGRIVLDDKSGSGIKCKICGKETSSGVLCTQCKNKLASQNFFSKEGQNSKSEQKIIQSGVLPLSKK